MGYDRISVHGQGQRVEPRLKLFSKRFPKESKYMKDFLRKLSLGEINKGKSVKEVRQVKYMDLLTPFFNSIKKPMNKLTKEDMHNFVEQLQKDKIVTTTKSKRPYAAATKQDILISLRTYIKYRLPNKYIPLTEFFDTRIPKKTPEILTEEEIEKLIDNCSNISDKFLVCVLFDSGLRIEEFLNVRFEDIIHPTENFPYYKIDAKQEYSKTNGRPIGMYWKNSSKIIRDYLKENTGNAKDPVYNRPYDNVRKFLARLGERVLKKKVHAHIFRKSSATFYADKLNRQQLCIRYGWAFSSEMPDLYIKRAGVNEEEIKEKFLNSDIQKLEKQNQELLTKHAILNERLDNVEKKRKIETDFFNTLIDLVDNTKKTNTQDLIKKIRKIQETGLYTPEELIKVEVE